MIYGFLFVIVLKGLYFVYRGYFLEYLTPVSRGNSDHTSRGRRRVTKGSSGVLKVSGRVIGCSNSLTRRDVDQDVNGNHSLYTPIVLYVSLRLPGTVTDVQPTVRPSPCFWS